jgi:hypothetical protein
MAILFFTAISTALAQKYSSIIPDTEIEEFIQWEMSNTPKFREDRKVGKKALFYQPISWKKADIQLSGPKGDSLSFRIKFYFFLKKDTLFNNNDIIFFEQQYNSEIITPWKKKFKNVDLKRTLGLKTHLVTIPMFSLDKSKVIIWKYFYCGSLCAYACLYIYEKIDNNNWILISKYGCWMS